MQYWLENFPERLNSDEFLSALDAAFLRIGVKVDVEIHFEDTDEWSEGFTDYEKGEEYAVISINSSLSVSETLQTIIHELVHVQQIDKGMLEYDGLGNLNIWHGTVINKPYLQRPWEIDAYVLDYHLSKEIENELRLPTR